MTTQQDVSCGVQNISTGDAMAQDSSGYPMYVTSYTKATGYARDGSIVNDQTQSAYTVKDANGNYFSQDAGGNIIDTLGRTSGFPLGSKLILQTGWPGDGGIPPQKAHPVHEPDIDVEIFPAPPFCEDDCHGLHATCYTRTRVIRVNSTRVHVYMWKSGEARAPSTQKH